ncbi:VCBS domain-containing protein [Vibrio sp. DW001]|uniref:VCBS domain-containing protein n=1 Tax=Vibrio sp. DW001 TaxID=2912315 RepID=UPI0023B08CC5|nr:VCBS domain-containing protein [Vibrio sp. DW001]WED29219.1 VCBS domain-containing protein [Vibrio sp. DW001]
MNIIDSDAGEAHFSDTDIVSTLGTPHLSDSGAWTYNLDNNNPIVQALGKGSSVTDIIAIQSTDGSPHQITITINGTNDIPVIGLISSNTVDEGQPPITGQITSTDIDHGDTVTYSTPLSHSGFVLHPDGSYTVDPSDKSFDHLAVGEHETLVIPIIATDNSGGNSVSQLPETAASI